MINDKNIEVCNDCGTAIESIVCIENEKKYCMKCGNKHGFDTSRPPTNNGVYQKVGKGFFEKVGIR